MAIEMSDSQSMVVVVMKVALVFISGSIMLVNILCYYEYDGMEDIFEDFDDGEWPLCMAFFGFMSMLTSIYGAIVFYVESDLKLKAVVRKAVYGYFMWEIALFCKYIISATCLFYAFQATGELFDEGFFEAMRKYKTNDHVVDQIEKIQNRFFCCGNYEYTEWFKIDWKRSMGEQLMGFPKSCCDFWEAEARDSQCYHEVPYQEAAKLIPVSKGCLEFVKWWYAFYLFVSACLFSLAAFIQMISLVAETVLVTRGMDTNIGEDQLKLLSQQHAIFDAISNLGIDI